MVSQSWRGSLLRHSHWRKGGREGKKGERECETRREREKEKGGRERERERERVINDSDVTLK